MSPQGGARAMWTDLVLPEWLTTRLVWFALAGAIVIVVGLYVWASRDPHPAEKRAYDGLRIVTIPEPGTVSVRFRTYSLVLGFVIHREHRFWASPEDARIALWRLHKFNLTWGFVYGAFSVPLVSFGDYVAQKRSIGRQAERFSSGVKC
jgi:hypothetical protein